MKAGGIIGQRPYIKRSSDLPVGAQGRLKVFWFGLRTVAAGGRRWPQGDCRFGHLGKFVTGPAGGRPAVASGLETSFGRVASAGGQHV